VTSIMALLKHFQGAERRAGVPAEVFNIYHHTSSSGLRSDNPAARETICEFYAGPLYSAGLRAAAADA